MGGLPVGSPRPTDGRPNDATRGLAFPPPPARARPRQAGIDKPITPRKLRHAHATHRSNAGAERVDLQALLGHSTINTPRWTPPWGQDRRAAAVARWNKSLLEA